MPRPCKRRLICAMPKCMEFGPRKKIAESRKDSGECIVMSIDEFEAIRLIDFEGLNQEESAGRMGVARTTVQAIYARARKKLAVCIVNGLPLTIDGGDYRLCKNADEICGEAECKAKRGICGNPTAGSFVNVPKGGKMKIAVTYENGNVFQHFGHSSEFKIYDIENDAVAKSEVIGTGGEGHGALATLLAEQKVDVLICGNIGQGAKQALAEIGVKLYPGVSGEADKAVEGFLKGTLTFNPDAQCNHHEHEHGHEHAHSHCGGHCGR